MSIDPGATNRTAGNRALMSLFLAAICVPGAVQLLGLSEPGTETVEKRKAAPFPKLEFRRGGEEPVPKSLSWESFPTRFESYYNDHFGLRRLLIRSYNRARFNGFTPAILDNPFDQQQKNYSAVVIGRSGWLYYVSQRNLANFRGTYLFTPEELQDWKGVLVDRRDRLAQHGIRYLVIIPPDKQTIYPEYLPTWIDRTKTTSRLDQLLDSLRDEPGIEIVDLRGALRESKTIYPTYFRTDSHWNDFGAFIAYQQIMRRISHFFPEAQPDALEDYEVRVRDTHDAHDLQVMLDVPLADVAVDLVPHRPRRAQSDPSTGSNPIRVTRNPEAPLRRAVVFHDSFFNQVQPYFDEHWGEVTYVSGRQLPMEDILADPPQLVLEEFVERKLMLQVPQK